MSISTNGSKRTRLTGKTIYHFGTGTHHIVGLRQAELGNAVFAITASKEEYDAYVELVTENARVARSISPISATSI